MTTEQLRYASEAKLPPINPKISPTKVHRTRISSSNDFTNLSQKYSTQLIPIDDLKPQESYDTMAQKQLVREHEFLLKRLFKYRELVDIILYKSPPQSFRQKPKSNVQVLSKQMQNNLKIIANHNIELRDLEKLKQHRSLQQILQQQDELEASIAKLKKETFDLKNIDVINSKNLLTQKEVLERQRHEMDMAYKTELKKNTELKRRFEELQGQIDNLKKKESPVKDTNNNKNQYAYSYQKYLEKKQHLETLKSQVDNKDKLLNEFFNVKTTRNNNLSKDLQTLEKKIKTMEKEIEDHKLTRRKELIMS